MNHAAKEMTSKEKIDDTGIKAGMLVLNNNKIAYMRRRIVARVVISPSSRNVRTMAEMFAPLFHRAMIISQ